MKEQITSLFLYSQWVNQRLLDAAAPLSTDQFTKKILPGFGSVHLTFVHLLGAEVIWFARWQGGSPRSLLSPEALPTVSAIQDHWDKLIVERQAYLSGLDEGAFSEIVGWTNTRGQSYSLPRWQVMLHCINHSTHHRSELAAQLSMLGHEPDSTDLLEFYLSRAGQSWKPSVVS